jgi:hypothetical protein
MNPGETAVGVEAIAPVDIPCLLLHTGSMSRVEQFLQAIFPGLLLFLAMPPVDLMAQSTARTQFLFVSARDSSNRFVTGLSQDDFEVTQQGMKRTITYFSDAESRLCVAAVGGADDLARLDIGSLDRPQDEVFKTLSVNAAVSWLASCNGSRKALVLAPVADDPRLLPSNVHLLRVSSGSLHKGVVEVASRYVIAFESSSTTEAASPNVGIKGSNLGRLTILWK